MNTISTHDVKFTLFLFILHVFVQFFKIWCKGAPVFLKDIEETQQRFLEVHLLKATYVRELKVIPWGGRAFYTLFCTWGKAGSTLSTSHDFIFEPLNLREAERTLSTCPRTFLFPVLNLDYSGGGGGGVLPKMWSVKSPERRRTTKTTLIITNYKFWHALSRDGVRFFGWKRKKKIVSLALYVYAN